MKLKYNFVINQVADKFVAVAVGEDLEEFGGIVKLNDVSAYIFKMLKNDVSEDDIVSAMINDFTDDSETEIRETVQGFIKQLQENDMLV